jgi:excisionase family DNA binding protein
MRPLLTTAEAAERLGVSPSRVRQFILDGRLPAQKVGRDLFIKESDLKRVRERPTGRPSRGVKKGGKK